jgi:hypothetical protein
MATLDYLYSKLGLSLQQSWAIFTTTLGYLCNNLGLSLQQPWAIFTTTLGYLWRPDPLSLQWSIAGKEPYVLFLKSR